jgi:probable HAF family extracellular repeat protein
LPVPWLRIILGETSPQDLPSYSSTQIQIPCAPQNYGQPKKCFENPYHAFLWTNGTMKDLGTLGGNFSKGVAINRSGEVVGTADTRAGSSDGFLWNGGKSMVDIGTWTPAGINDAGQAAGACFNASGPCFSSRQQDCKVRVA